MKIVRRLLATLLFLVLLLTGMVWYVAGTESGLQFVGHVVQSQFGEALHIGRLSGRLATAIDIEDLRIQVKDDVYRIERLHLDWSPRALLDNEVRINRLDAESVTVSIAASAEPGGEDFSLDIELPVDITVAESSIRTLIIKGVGEEAVVINRINLSARAEDRQLAIQRLQLTADSYQAGLAGTLGLQPDRSSDLHLDWRVAIQGDAPFSTAGEANISGLLRAYNVQGETSVSGANLPAGRWQFSGEGSLDGLTLQQLKGETLDGTVTGKGQMDWQQGFGWQLALDMNQVNPGTHWPEWPGSLTAQLSSSGRLVDDRSQIAVQLLQLQGQLRGYPVTGKADVKLENELLAIKQLDITSGDNRIRANGTLDSSWSLMTEAEIPDVAAFLPGWEGGGSLSGRIEGERDQPRVSLRIKAGQLAGPSLSVDGLSGNVQLHWSETGQQSVAATMQGVQLAGQHYSSATLDFTGTLHRHQLTLEASGKETELHLQLAGDWTDNRWQGELRKADWQLPGTGRWALQQPVAATVGAEEVRLANTCWINGSAQLCMDARGNPEKQFTSTVELGNFPLQTLGALGGSALTLTSLVDAEFHATLDAGRVSQADLQVTLGAGSVSYDDPDFPSDSRIRQGKLRALLNADGLSAEATLDLSAADYLRADLQLPAYQAGITPWKEQQLAMNLSGELRDLLFVKYLLDEVGSYEGSVSLNLEGRGTLGQPRISGNATVTDSSLEIDALGISLTDLDLQLQSRIDGLVITGSCTSGKGRVQLDGDVNLVDIAHWQADINLQGKDFEVMHLPEGIIEMSPDLQARIAPPAINLTGELHVPYARLRPKNLSQRAGLSSDVVIIDSEQTAEPPERWQVSSKIRLSLGDDVEIDGYGLKGDLLGSVDLLDKPGYATTAQGSLAIERGSYEIYGRKLDISRGQLLFSGGVVANPGLDFEASRRVRDVTAGIRARGTLRKPEMTLFSDPSMADGDIISYIAFGKPQAEAGQGGGSVTDAGLVAGGNLLAGVIGTSVGLEELGVESGDTLEDAAMVLGTYLSPQLYVRYRTGLYNAINEFEARYEFSRRWSIRTVTSVETSSAEILFSFER